MKKNDDGTTDDQDLPSPTLTTKCEVIPSKSQMLIGLEFFHHIVLKYFIIKKSR